MADENAPRTTRKPAATRRRKSLAGDDGSRQISRPLLVAMLVILAGAAFLFWPRGGSPPTGIGEQYSIVTADSTAHAAPRSGNVDIASEQAELVPESPEPRAATGTDAPREPVTVTDTAAAGDGADAAPAAPDRPSRSTTPTTARSREAQPASPPTAADDADRIEPRRSGPWAVQLGAYQSEDNANGLVARLAERGYEARVRSASTSSGAIIHRVWIGWFPSRDEALAYAAQEKDRIGEAYPVHR